MMLIAIFAMLYFHDIALIDYCRRCRLRFTMMPPLLMLSSLRRMPMIDCCRCRRYADTLLYDAAFAAAS